MATRLDRRTGLAWACWRTLSRAFVLAVESLPESIGYVSDISRDTPNSDDPHPIPQNVADAAVVDKPG